MNKEDKELFYYFRKAWKLFHEVPMGELVLHFDIPGDIETEEEAKKYIKNKLEEIISENDI